jgi:hypothetical protein
MHALFNRKPLHNLPLFNPPLYTVCIYYSIYPVRNIMIKPLIFHTENIRAPTTMAAVPQTSKVHRSSCPPPAVTACQPTHDSWPAQATAGGGGAFWRICEFLRQWRQRADAANPSYGAL